MKPANLLILILAAVLTASSCKESITDSRPRIIRPPQEMIWTADTIRGLDQYAQLTPRNLYVFSANDAWLTCWCDIARGLIWHWDGKSWNESDIRKDVGGMRIQDVCGYSSSDLWACGYSGEEIFLAHYNGTKWTRYNTNGIKGELIKMCKDADGNIWACGRNGVIMKFDKTKWVYNHEKLPIPDNHQQFYKSLSYYLNEIHLIATSVNPNNLIETYYYIKGSINNWTVIDSMKIDSPTAKIKWGYYSLYSNENLWLYSVGALGCWKLQNRDWIKFLDYNGVLYQISGTGDNYLIICSANKTIKYYNGSTWMDFSTILKVTDPLFVFKNVWTNGYETFVVGYSSGDKVVIWRGK